ncbi:helix-turn-helix domain-containing protein [Roseimicrobium gellanilyticum]|uniref:helix-turn-helix domain-containing protein n=1 Tax=Roseimicrobium gellanilyticum TaxID=748857 RepID=UPI000DEA587E|nr:helix-turn-helix transcriptional regulator [Roseimicrobium gellanilyticum]
MSATTTPEVRFRMFCERAGLTHDEAARQMGISPASVWDMESHENELSSCYSPSQVQQFCRVLGIHPCELFAVETAESPVSAIGLVQLIHEQCLARGVTLEQFEDAVGWRLSACMEPPERLLEEMTVDGLQWLCRELGIHWHRVILGL